MIEMIKKGPFTQATVGLHVMGYYNYWAQKQYASSFGPNNNVWRFAPSNSIDSARPNKSIYPQAPLWIINENQLAIRMPKQLRQSIPLELHKSM